MDYYYHTDHLGSTSLLTDSSAAMREHLEYTPWHEQPKYKNIISEVPGGVGESWYSLGGITNYKFTGKELDPTGLYYFGARYYDPQVSMWLSTDPILQKYIDGEKAMGGVFKSINLNLYNYAVQNPLIFIDPNGLEHIIFYYETKDNAFEKAANTKSEELYKQTGDKSIMIGVKTETQFKQEWNKLKSDNTSVNSVNFLGHGGFEGDKSGALYFLPDSNNDGTLTNNEIFSLPLLNYTSDAYISIAACNSGVGDNSVAQAFANSQNKTSWGEMGFAYFSNNKYNYSMMSSNSLHGYLGAYHRGRNLFSSNTELGKLIPQKAFKHFMNISVER